MIRNLRLFSLAFWLASIVGSQGANADSWSTAVGWRCDESQSHLIVYPLRFDANLPMPESIEGGYVPMADGWDQDRRVIEVLECDLGTRGVGRMERIHLHTPKPWGACGGAAWSEYIFTIERELVARFTMGCNSGSLLQADENSIMLCRFGQKCRKYEGEPLRLHLFSSWD